MITERKLKYPLNFKISSNSMFINISKNILHNYSNHEGTLISNSNISLKCSCFYYEIIINNNERGTITVGFVSEKKFKGNSLGKKEGYGFRTDGRLISPTSPNGIEWGLAQPWGRNNDTIGCGYLTKTKEIFFTQNGKLCGIAFRLGESTNRLGNHNINEDDEDFTPCISLGALREVKANFGEEDFAFDIYSYLKSLELERQKEIHQINISSSIVQDMIREYLLYHGYKNTLQAFEKVIHRSPNQDTKHYEFENHTNSFFLNETNGKIPIHETENEINQEETIYSSVIDHVEDMIDDCKDIKQIDDINGINNNFLKPSHHIKHKNITKKYNGNEIIDINNHIHNNNNQSNAIHNHNNHNNNNNNNHESTEDEIEDDHVPLSNHHTQRNFNRRNNTNTRLRNRGRGNSRRQNHQEIDENSTESDEHVHNIRRYVVDHRNTVDSSQSDEITDDSSLHHFRNDNDEQEDINNQEESNEDEQDDYMELEDHENDDHDHDEDDDDDDDEEEEEEEEERNIDDDDNEDEKDDVRNERNFIIDDEEEDEEEEEEESKSNSDRLTEQLHSALQELSQTHNNIRYIHTSTRSRPIVNNNSSTTSSITASSESQNSRSSLRSSLNSIVTGIRRVTDNPTSRIMRSESYLPSRIFNHPPMTLSTSSLDRRSNNRRIPTFHLYDNDNDEDDRRIEEEKRDFIDDSLAFVWVASLNNFKSTESQPIHIRDLLYQDGYFLNESLLRKTLHIRHQARQYLKQKKYQELIYFLNHLTSYNTNGYLNFSSFPASIYLNCLIFIEYIKSGNDDVALEFATKHLLPILLQESVESNSNIDETNNINSNHFSTGTKKRSREPIEEEDCEPQNYHKTSSTSQNNSKGSYVKSHSINSIVSTSSIEYSQFIILEKLIRDVVSLFSLQISSLSKSDDNLTNDSSNTTQNSIEQLYIYFTSTEFQEIVIESINYYILQLHKHHFSTILPSYHTSLELCLSHYKVLKSIQNSSEIKNKRYINWKDELSSEYFVYSPKWNQQTKRKKKIHFEQDNESKSV